MGKGQHRMPTKDELVQRYNRMNTIPQVRELDIIHLPIYIEFMDEAVAQKSQRILEYFVHKRFLQSLCPGSDDYTLYSFSVCDCQCENSPLDTIISSVRSRSLL